MKQSTMIMIVVGVLVLGAAVLLSNNQKSAENMNKEAVTTESNTTVTQGDEKGNKTIVQVAESAGNFKTLVAAIQAAGLAETLSREGPFTVFAPTDEAFAKLPAGTVEGLLKDKQKLAKILTYHVVPGKVMAKDVVTLTTAKTVEGSDLLVKVVGGKVMINDATVTTPDIEASNGVVHVVDTVLLPQ